MYYSQFEACHILGVAYTTLRRWVKKYHITYRRSVAGKIRLSEAGLEELRLIKVRKHNNKRA